MTEFDYPAPVSDLLTLGDCRDMRVWPDYLALGIGPEHISDLIRMVEDDELNWADSDSLEVWAPAHAGQRRERRSDSWFGSRPAPGGPLILVDDVITTGATLRAARRAIGQTAIYGVTATSAGRVVM